MSTIIIRRQGRLEMYRQGADTWRRVVDHPPAPVRRLAGHMLLVIATKPAAEEPALRKAA